MGDLVAHVVVDSVPDGLKEEVTTALRDCPVNAITMIPDSGRFPHDHHKEAQDEEHGGEIREYQRKQRHATNDNHIETNDAERLERTEDYLAIVGNDSDDDQHPGRISGP